MKFPQFLLIVLIMSCPIFGSSFMRTIGAANSLSATVIVEIDAEIPDFGDSLCYRYWFFNNTSSFSPRDYRITIYRNPLISGVITVFANGFFGDSHDTLHCDSLGFQPSPLLRSVDTIKTDTTIIYWNYLRLTKRLAASNVSISSFSNHLKICLSTSSYRDSIIFTRKKIVYTRVIQEYNNDNQQLLSTDYNGKACRQSLFDIRGRKIQFSNILTSQVVVKSIQGSHSHSNDLLFIRK